MGFCPARLYRKGWETREGWRLAVFAYHAKPFVKNYPDGVHGYLVGFHGLVFADPADGMVLRLEVETDGPLGYPYEESGWEVDYGAVTIAERQLVLPVKAVMHSRRGRFLSRNEIQFTKYRKYEADSSITFN
jgi:hypothetical protein